MPIDDLGTEDYLEIGFISVGFKGSYEFRQMIGVCEKLSSGDRATTTNPGDDDGGLARIGVSEPGHDGEILIIVCGELLGPVDGPANSGGILRVNDTELGHIGIVGEVIAELLGEAECPGVIKCSDEDCWPVAKIRETRFLFSF